MDGPNLDLTGERTVSALALRRQSRLGFGFDTAVATPRVLDTWASRLYNVCDYTHRLRYGDGGRYTQEGWL